MFRSALALLAVLVLAGCGRERLSTPDLVRPVITPQKAPQSFPTAGIAFEAPAGWSFGGGEAPLVTQTSSGSATIAVWRYPRSEPLPEGGAPLDHARSALLGAVRQRDAGYRAMSSRKRRIDGKAAIELVGEERVAGQARRVRSTHVYAEGAELVIDQYAAPADFEAIDEAVFRPLLDSMRIERPRG